MTTILTIQETCKTKGKALFSLTAAKSVLGIEIRLSTVSNTTSCVHFGSNNIFING